MKTPRPPRRRHHANGFATLMAVALISFLAMTLLAMTTLFQTDARRTQRQHAQAQLRQLLLAGADLAEAQLDRWTEQDGPLVPPIPPDMDDAELTIVYRSDPPDMIIATVEARFQEYKASQRLTFRVDGLGYTLSNAELFEHH